MQSSIVSMPHFGYAILARPRAGHLIWITLPREKYSFCCAGQCCGGAGSVPSEYRSLTLESSSSHACGFHGL
jgi:hypothetical protein